MTDDPGEWRPVPVEPPLSDWYEIRKRPLKVRGVERRIVRSNGSPYTVKGRPLKLRRDKYGIPYCILATGRARKYRVLYLNARTIAKAFA